MLYYGKTVFEHMVPLVVVLPRLDIDGIFLEILESGGGVIDHDDPTKVI